LPAEVAQEVPPDDHFAIRGAVLRFLKVPPGSGRARSVVRQMSWDAVAHQLEGIYLNVVQRT